MKNSNSQKRIRELMDFYGLSQSELCRRTGIQKSALSNYLSGTREPRQDQISLIADPFNVNPAWLMGYDVPMLMPTKFDFIYTDEEKELILEYRAASDTEKDTIKRLLTYSKLMEQLSKKDEDA